jgi:hypothetical protein
VSELCQCFPCVCGVVGVAVKCVCVTRSRRVAMQPCAPFFIQIPARNSPQRVAMSRPILGYVARPRRRATGARGCLHTLHPKPAFIMHGSRVHIGTIQCLWTGDGVIRCMMIGEGWAVAGRKPTP